MGGGNTRQQSGKSENRIKPRVYVRRITHSTMFEKAFFAILLAETGVRKISSVACGFSPIKIHYFDDPKRFINRINEVYVFFSIKYRYSYILLKKTYTSL